MSDKNEIFKILDRNRGKNFVERIIRTDAPALQNPDGSISTHEMAWGEAAGRFFVYPTIVQQGVELNRLDDSAAFRYAIENQEFIEFDSAAEADWFSRNYKAIWGSGRR